VGLRALWEHSSGGSGAGPIGSGAWGEADRERARAWSFGKRQGAPKTGREHGSGRLELGRERGSGTLPLGARFGDPDWWGGDASATLASMLLYQKQTATYIAKRSTK
jgi:hypothetical protein